MKIKGTSVPVLDQEKALQFYTNKLGFIKRHDIPVGNDSRWLTVVSPEEQDGHEVLLEPAPLHFEPSKVYQKALLDAGIPCNQFYVDNVQEEYERLQGLGVEFSMAPTEMGTVKVAILNDTVGNLVQLVEEL